MYTKMLELANRVAKALADPSHVTYTLADDIYPALIEADTAILNYRPDLNPVEREISTVLGSRQNIPATDLRLIDVPCNLVSTGVEGRDIIRTERALLHPKWRTQAPADEAVAYMFDDRLPRQFEVTPPLKANKLLRIITSTPFTAYGVISASTDSKLPITYDTAKIEFALWRCFSRDNSPLAERANVHLQAFNTLLGIKDQRDTAASPKAGSQDT